MILSWEVSPLPPGTLPFHSFVNIALAQIEAVSYPASLHSSQARFHFITSLSLAYTPQAEGSCPPASAQLPQVPKKILAESL